jgi:hypothetical protein
MRRSWPALRGRRDSLRPGQADPAGALAAVIAEAAACVDSARCALLARTGVPQPSQRPPRCGCPARTAAGPPPIGNGA